MRKITITVDDATVALRKESVDRNTILRCLKHETLVALRKESVDRNMGLGMVLTSGIVALRKESVDRNIILLIMSMMQSTSLSARRAWIEITLFLSFRLVVGVALRKESVDRNTYLSILFQQFLSRSPQGERG